MSMILIQRLHATPPAMDEFVTNLLLIVDLGTIAAITKTSV